MGKKVEMAQTGKENKKTSVEEPVTSKTTKPKSNGLKRKRTCTHTHTYAHKYIWLQIRSVTIGTAIHIPNSTFTRGGEAG